MLIIIFAVWHDVVVVLDVVVVVVLDAVAAVVVVVVVPRFLHLGLPYKTSLRIDGARQGFCAKPLFIT